jgi:hypothetical protein
MLDPVGWSRGRLRRSGVAGFLSEGRGHPVGPKPLLRYDGGKDAPRQRRRPSVPVVSAGVLCKTFPQAVGKSFTFARFAARPVMFPVLRPFGGIAAERRYAFSEQQRQLLAFLEGPGLIVGVGFEVRVAVDLIEQGDQRLDGPFNVAAGTARDFDEKAGLGHCWPRRAAATTRAASAAVKTAQSMTKGESKISSAATFQGIGLLQTKFGRSRKTGVSALALW